MHILMMVAAWVFFIASYDNGWWAAVILLGLWFLPTYPLWTTFCVTYIVIGIADMIYIFLYALLLTAAREFVKTLHADAAKKKFQDALKGETPKDDGPSKT